MYLMLMLSRVEDLSKKKGVTMTQTATARQALAKDGVTAPIVGTTSLKNLEELTGTHLFLNCPLASLPYRTPCIAAVHISLSEEELKYLEEPYKPSPVLGH